VGPAGEITLSEGIIIAHRHLHLHPSQAQSLCLQDKDIIRVHIDGPRELVFDRVLVRVSPNYAMDLHLDTDEANAACIKNGDLATLVR